MGRLKTFAKKKLKKALVRVEKVVILDIRKGLSQQKKWKAKVVNRQKKPVVAAVETTAKAA